jgi:hypothetical protein
MKAILTQIKQKKYINKKKLTLLLIFIGMLLCLISSINAQVVSPLQGGHFSPSVSNVRDMATPPPGLFLLWYNVYSSSSKYIDRDGNEFNSIRLDQIYPGLPNIDVSLELDAFASIPTIFWASHFKLMGGARYMAGFSLNYVSADASIITERAGIINPDTTITRKAEGKNSGLSDMLFVPVGLSWQLEKFDMTFLYGFVAPTGSYESGSAENIGLGFWTHQFQGYGYFYPVPEKSTAIMLGLTFELNSKIKDADVKPGNRFSLEWGVSQYFSEQFELNVKGGHNWQISDDTGNEVYWDPRFHDRKSTILFGANYWPWKERLSLALKYGLDYGVRQRFQNNSWLFNIIFIPNIFTGK